MIHGEGAKAGLDLGAGASDMAHAAHGAHIGAGLGLGVKHH
jgi:hypothetical protein